VNCSPPPACRRFTTSDRLLYFEPAGTANTIGTVVMRPTGWKSRSQSCLNFGFTIGTTTVSVPPMYSTEPSGGAPSTFCTASMPLAPVTFSMITWRLRRLDSSAPTARATRSALPPAE
jgi:hypothetical protein